MGFHTWCRGDLGVGFHTWVGQNLRVGFHARARWDVSVGFHARNRTCLRFLSLLGNPCTIDNVVLPHDDNVKVDARRDRSGCGERDVGPCQRT